MSHKFSKPSGERSIPSHSPNTSAAQQQLAAEPGAARKRSNTRHNFLPPAIHLSLKTSSAALRSPSADGGVNLNYDIQRATGGKAKKPSGSASPSTASPSTGRSAGYSPSSYGTHKSVSPLSASPDCLGAFPDLTSSSLPVTLSALSSEPSLDLVAPSPTSVSSARRPSLAPYAHGHPQAGLAQSRSNTNLRVAATRMPSDPSSRKSSIVSVERDAGVHLDMKRLLSKPAQSHSGSSIASMNSDSEAPRSPKLHPSIARQPSSQRLATGPAPKERTTTRRATDEGPTSLRKSASRASLHTSAIQQPPKTRNVLRRKTSTLSNPATPTAQTFQQAQTSSSQPASRSSSKAPRPVEPPRANAPRRAASAVATAPAESVSVSHLRRHRSPPADLTPAGAVAHAYKQQEQRRSQLERDMSDGGLQGPSDDAPRERSADSRATRQIDEEDEEGSGAYYTVFGGSAGRVVAVGSVEDSDWDLGYDSRFSQDGRRVPVRADSGGVSSVRSLGRKVSGKFKRSGPGHVGREHSPYAPSVARVPDEPFDGRPDSRTANVPRPLGPSMDEYVDIRTQVSAIIPSVQNGTPEKKDKETARTLRTMRSVIGKDSDVDKSPGDESSPGGKLWKLMKRISTGALRDKYHDTTPPPPVPALPDDYKHLASSRTTFDIRKGRDDSSETGVSRFMHSRTSMSAVRPSTAPQRSTPRSEAPGSRPSTGPRQSTTTRSSSPMSSDMASSRFFHRSHSQHSSISSYGEELPPLPNASTTNVGQHILTPGELYKLSTTDEAALKRARQRSRSRTRSLGGEDAPRPVTEPRPSLPPPRRSNTSGGKPATDNESDPPSPLIPTFETSEPTNHFPAMSASRYSLPTSEFGVMSDNAPPRPKRSSRRKPPPFDLMSPSGSTPTSPLPVTPRTPRSPGAPTINVDVRSLDRKSIAGSSMHSTIHESAHVASPSSATASHFRSPLRFREMDSPRQALSERQKAAKWDDLLMRSEQAGGTLHLGESGLMSDNIRFSDYSGSES